jgi:rare lipoprotein A
MNARFLILVVAVFVLGACSGLPEGGGYYKDDGPPRRPAVDVSRVPDAVPRHEPRSPRGNAPYQALGRWYHPLDSAHGYRERGVASWYGRRYHGRETSMGEPYDMYAMTAAHPTLPLPSYVRVTSLDNGASVVLRVNDRGPFLRDRIIDVSYAAADRLGMIATGTGRVEVEAVFPEGQRAVAPAATEPPAGQPVNASWFVQVGAFSRSDHADDARGRLVDGGIEPVFIETIERGGQRLHRVRVGPLSSAEQAESIRRRVVDSGAGDPVVLAE